MVGYKINLNEQITLYVSTVTAAINYSNHMTILKYFY